MARISSGSRCFIRANRLLREIKEIGELKEIHSHFNSNNNAIKTVQRQQQILLAIYDIHSTEEPHAGISLQRPAYTNISEIAGV